MATWERIRLLVAASLFLMAMLPWPAQAGTAEAPEITDPANDQEVLGEVPGCVTTQCAAAARIDATKVWIDNETATSINVNIVTASAPGAATAATSRYDFHATFEGSEVVAVVTAVGGQTVVPPAPTSNVAAVSVSGNTLTMTILKSVYGAPAAGQSLTNLYYLGVSTLPPPVPGAAPSVATDRAPNSGAGTDYMFVGGGSGGLPGDADGDGLNDTWEIEQFGNMTMHNGTADPDGDGLNNSAEFAAGTNATNPDTDGDFLQDGVDPFPLDPTQPADSDGDGLNDSWERTHFTAMNAQNGTGDPDTDGLNNTQEQALGTDPNREDTDGDGVADGEDSAPLNPAVSGATPASAGRSARPELYAGAAMFAAASTFILLGLARGI